MALPSSSGGCGHTGSEAPKEVFVEFWRVTTSSCRHGAVAMLWGKLELFEGILYGASISASLS